MMIDLKSIIYLLNIKKLYIYEKINVMKKLILLLLVFLQVLHGQNSYVINAGSYYYSPSTLEINVGDIVNWYNDGGFHNVNFDTDTQTGESFGNPESFSSAATSSVGALIYSHQFNVEGTYTYDCSIGSHAANGMVGTIVVSSEQNSSSRM